MEVKRAATGEGWRCLAILLDLFSRPVARKSKKTCDVPGTQYGPRFSSRRQAPFRSHI